LTNVRGFVIIGIMKFGIIEVLAITGILVILGSVVLVSLYSVNATPQQQHNRDYSHCVRLAIDYNRDITNCDKIKIENYKLIE